MRSRVRASARAQSGFHSFCAASSAFRDASGVRPRPWPGGDWRGGRRKASRYTHSVSMSVWGYLSGFGGREMAVDIGAGLPVSEPTGNMIVDIGGGTTEVAVISLGGIVVSQSIRVGGDEMDEAIMSHIKKEYKLLIGQQTAEELKLEIGSAWELSEEVQAEVRGRDMLTGLPKTIVITSEEVRRALDEPVGQILDAIKSTLDKTPPELAADIMDRGIVLAGGGSLLTGLEERLREETQMPVQLAESPLTCVAVGSGRSLEEFEVIHRPAKARQRNGRRR